MVYYTDLAFTHGIMAKDIQAGGAMANYMAKKVCSFASD